MLLKNLQLQTQQECTIVCVCVLGMGYDKDFLSQYMRVIITITDIVMIVFKLTVLIYIAPRL